MRHVSKEKEAKRALSVAKPHIDQNPAYQIGHSSSYENERSKRGLGYLSASDMASFNMSIRRCRCS
jgi:hypothetical protein